ncbi:hypothetical protein NDU88_005114 [Pleurodeles waltl]|uniref:Uncharacterized protein n=1 Tax=Pleurodeles waltl TaxID=8319 RepID=A0AAV7RHL5_PLEWA|nr:hypothetical protein NDU88_005114 [Pleurodeles waltl]
MGESAQQPDQSSRTLPTSDRRVHMKDSSQAGVRRGEAAPPGSVAPPVLQAVKNVPNNESGMAKQHLLDEQLLASCRRRKTAPTTWRPEPESAQGRLQ